MTIALYAVVWMALVLLVLAEAGRGPLANGQRPAPWAWSALTLGACLVAVHVVLALAVRYGWNHDLAVRETARQAATVYGFEWRGNIYVSYAFVLLWFAEVWRRRPTLHAATAVRPRWATWVWRGFFFVVIVNAAVVFATTPATRLFGMVLVAALAWAWWPVKPVYPTA